MTQRLLRSAPEAIGAGVEAYPSVLARIDPLRGPFQAGREPLEGRRIGRLVRVKPDVGTNHADHREPLADVDMLPRAISLSAVQCAHRGGRRCIASQIVRLPAAELQRRLIRWIGYLMPRRLVADAAHVRGDQVAAADIPVR